MISVVVMVVNGSGNSVEVLMLLLMLSCVQAGDQAILSLHRTVITQNDRISLTYDEHNTWSLHIK